MTAPASGGCLCGAVRYTLAESARDVTACHCAMCRRSSGGAFQVYCSVPLAALSWVRGTPKIYRSSPHASRGFCPDCGTPLVFIYDPKPARISITVGSFDRPELAAPTEHWGVESWLPWLKIDDDLPRWRTDDDPDAVAVRRQAGKGA